MFGVANVGAAALAPLLRFRRADPVQRQQLTWFAFVIVLIVVAFLVGIAVQGALPIVATVLVTVGFGGVLVGFPAAVGLAILGVAALFQPARRRIQQGRGSRRTGARARYALARTLPGRPEIDHSRSSDSPIDGGHLIVEHVDLVTRRCAPDATGCGGVVPLGATGGH